jgi:hypothetical protein
LPHRRTAFPRPEVLLEEDSVTEFRENLLPISDVPHLNRDQPLCL